MRRRRPQPTLVLAFVLIMGALMYAKDLPSPESELGLKMASSRLKVYYTEHPPGKDWRVKDIAIQGGAVWVDLSAPGAALIHAPQAKLLYTLRARCPLKTDAVWSVLLKTQDIEVRGLTPEGKVIAAVSCRAQPNT